MTHLITITFLTVDKCGLIILEKVKLISWSTDRNIPVRQVSVNTEHHTVTECLFNKFNMACPRG